VVLSLESVRKRRLACHARHALEGICKWCITLVGQACHAGSLVHLLQLLLLLLLLHECSRIHIVRLAIEWQPSSSLRQLA
jgi:hypothetical protein